MYAGTDRAPGWLVRQMRLFEVLGLRGAQYNMVWSRGVHRMRWLPFIALILIASIIVIAGLAQFGRLFWASKQNIGQGVVIVTSMPGLASDLEELACPADRVVFIVPAGLDPHSYQLKPSDYSIIKSASLLVIVGGEALGEALAIKAQELGVEVFKIMNVKGLTLLKTPTGKVNIHYPIYDPRNYVAFMRALAKKLAELNPECGDHYSLALNRVVGDVERILSSEGSLKGLRAVASNVMVQYAVTWLGVEIRGYVVEDPRGHALPSELKAVESLLKTGTVDLAFIVVDESGRPLTKADAWLLERAEEAGIPVIGVVAPYLPGSTLDKLTALLSELESLGLIGGS